MIELGGKAFRFADMERRTVLMDEYQTSLIAESGIDKVLPEGDEAPEVWLLRVSHQLRKSGKACEILSCYLLPATIPLAAHVEHIEGMERHDYEHELDQARRAAAITGGRIPTTERHWTPQMARETARHLSLLDTEPDRQQVQTLAMEFLVGFFRRAIASYETSRRSLPVPRSRGSRGDREAPLPAASGIRWFGRWRAWIMTYVRAPWLGRSASS
jgi:hypothetical protein